MCLTTDSWFGSYNMAEWLLNEMGIFCILANKTGHKGFPKKELIAKVSGERYSTYCMKLDVDLEIGIRTFYASAFQDKQTMIIVATAGTLVL